MATSNDLQARRDLAPAKAQAPRVDPVITVGEGKHVNAAQVVMGLATELNTGKIELPGFPDVVARIQRVLADETTSSKDVVKLVASEPALAARFVHLANSAAFNKSGREVSDLKTAINSLGYNIVRSQATAFAMRQMEQQEWLRPIRPVLADIWKTSNGVAALSFAVARHVPGVQPDESMATGLFHLIGKLYLFARARQESINPAEIADWEKALNEWHMTIARTHPGSLEHSGAGRGGRREPELRSSRPTARTSPLSRGFSVARNSTTGCASRMRCPSRTAKLPWPGSA